MKTDIPATSGYSIREVPRKSRAAKAIAMLGTSVLFAVLAWMKQAENNALGNAWVPLIWLIPSGLVAWGSWSTIYRKVYAGEWVAIPSKVRYKKAGIATLVLLGLCAITSWSQHEEGQLQSSWSLMLIFVIPYFAYMVYVLTTKREFCLDPDGVVEKQKDEKVRAGNNFDRKISRTLSRVWVRYPLAGLILWGAFTVVSQENHIWWWPVLLALWAAWLARELSLIVLFIAICYALLKGIASLPVSAAVIIGAIIIASALRRD